MKQSKFEALVNSILTKAHIPFIQEKTFEDLHNGYYRFDFYLPDRNSILELNGMQHYEFTKIFHKKRSDFTKSLERDRIKISYCLSHGITLYIIPYWELENLKIPEDLFQKKFIAHSKFHNDEVWREQKSKVKS